LTSRPDAITVEFEHEFAKVLNLAEDNIQQSNHLLQELLLSDVQRDSVPEIPVWRLHLSATATFLGIIQCLKTPSSSLGALSLLRGLVESWTHLYFIADETEKGTPAQRAIRYEAGVLLEWRNFDKKTRPGSDHEETRRRHHATIMRLWVANGGEDEPRSRTYRHVQPTWEKITALPQVKGIEALRDSSSVAVHVGAVDFLLAFNDSQITVEWVSPGRRSAWLLYAIVCFDNLTLSAFGSVPSIDTQAATQDLHLRWLTIANSAALAKAGATKREPEAGLDRL